jgi:hypothetical protein
MPSAYTFLNILFFLLFWFGIAATPVALYLNIKKESTENPLKRVWYRKWGMVAVILGPVLLLVLLPFISYARVFTLNFGV